MCLRFLPQLMYASSGKKKSKYGITTTIYTPQLSSAQSTPSCGGVAAAKNSKKKKRLARSTAERLQIFNE